MAHPDSPDHNGNSPLLIAVMNGDLDGVRNLLQVGASREFSLTRAGKTISPLSVAVQRDKTATQVTSSKVQKELVKELTMEMWHRGMIAMGPQGEPIEYNVESHPE